MSLAHPYSEFRRRQQSFSSLEAQSVLAEPLLFGLRPVRPSRHAHLFAIRPSAPPSLSPTPSSSASPFSLPSQDSHSPSHQQRRHRLPLPRHSDPAELRLFCSHLTAVQRQTDRHVAQAHRAAEMDALAAQAHARRRRQAADAEAEEHAGRIRRKGRVVVLDQAMRDLHLECQGTGPLEDAAGAYKRYEMAEPRVLGGTGRALKWIRTSEMGLLDEVELRQGSKPMRSPHSTPVRSEGFKFDFDLDGSRLARLSLGDGPQSHSTPARPSNGTPGPTRMLSRTKAWHSRSAFFTGSPLRFPTPTRLRVPAPFARVGIRAPLVLLASSAGQTTSCDGDADVSADESGISHIVDNSSSTVNQSGPSRAGPDEEEDDADDETDMIEEADYDQTFSDLSTHASFFGRFDRPR